MVAALLPGMLALGGHAAPSVAQDLPSPEAQCVNANAPRDFGISDPAAAQEFCACVGREMAARVAAVVAKGGREPNFVQRTNLMSQSYGDCLN